MSTTLQQELAGVRNEIDRLDAEILALLNQRAHCAEQVGEIKARHGEAGFIYRPEREAQVLRRIQSLNQGPLSDETVTWFFREIMSACLSLEQPLSIAFLGPLGSYTGMAALKHFGHAANLQAQSSIDDAIREVEAGHCQYAVVPVENSTEGAVGRTLDLLFATPLKLCGEVILPIHHNLLSKAGEFAAIKEVRAHAQALAQCHEWLNRILPGVPRVAVASNSLAAQMAGDDASIAAIAGDSAAELYGLNKLAASIEDEPNNTTRFVILGKHDAGLSGRDKTSLIMSAPNRTGALSELLEPFTSAGVSLTRLESRPARHALWEYVFYVDLEGHRDSETLKTALEELGRRAAYLKILGSYPVAVY